MKPIPFRHHFLNNTMAELLSKGVLDASQSTLYIWNRCSLGNGKPSAGHISQCQGKALMQIILGMLCMRAGDLKQKTALLFVNIVPQPELLEKHGWKANDAILTEEETVFEELKEYKVWHIPLLLMSTSAPCWPSIRLITLLVELLRTQSGWHSGSWVDK